MAVDAQQMAKARRRLEQSLETPSFTNALSVLDKAVGGLIDLAKGRNVIDGAPGNLLHSPFGSDVAGGADNVFGKAGGMPEDASEESMMATQKNKRDKQKTSKYGSTKDPYGPGNISGLAKSKRLRKGEFDPRRDPEEDDEEEDEGPPWRRKRDRDDDMRQSYYKGGEQPEEGDDDDDDDDDEHGSGANRSFWRKTYGEDQDPPRRNPQSDEEDEERSFGRTMDFANSFGDDEEEESRPRKKRRHGGDDAMAERMAKLRAMRHKSQESDDDEDDGDRDDDHRRSYGMNEGTMNNAYKSMRRRRYTINDIHKSLVSGPRGARVAEVVEASRELAHMVNVFGHILSDISGQVDQVRRDQFSTASVLTDAVNTVVKSQTAIAVGLERMAKSTAVLAKSSKSGVPASRSMQKSFGSTNPGVVMNGKVLTEGRDLRRSNAMVDETGYAVSDGLEGRLNKSLVGGVIQQAVLDGEFTAQDALRWLTETDSPASGPVAVFRQLPAKLQDRIVRKANEE